jgi:hypothetical protein
MKSRSKKSDSSKVEKLLVSFDLGRARTPNELEAVAAEIGRAFVESPELRKIARPPRGLWKRYIEEVLPLIYLTRWLFPGRLDVRCQPNLADSGNYDAVISFPNGDEIMRLFVEFTYAKDGFEDSLRMEVLNDEGHVNMLGEVIHSGTKHTGHQIEVRDRVALRSDVLERHRHLIVERIRAKANRRYGSNHILVVVFDSFTGPRSDGEMVGLTSNLQSVIDLSGLDFRSLYLLGSSGTIFSELSLER